MLRGSEKKAIISQLAGVYELNTHLIGVAQQRIPDKGSYLRKVIPFFIADTKAQVILGGCSSFTAKSPAATACWLSGKNRATILHEFGCGMGVIVEEWLWAGMIYPVVRPPPTGPPIMGCMVCTGKCTMGFQPSCTPSTRCIAGRSERP